jgi:zinc/manganese transport system substrate-binding protein
MKREAAAVLALVLVLGGAAALYFWSSGGGPGPGTTETSGSGVVQVVAAENFWGSLAAQIGGTRVHVFSIVSDPNADPHEHESNAMDAEAVANASLVIVNGAGYDTWALTLIAAGSNSHQTVLNVQELIGQEVGANPHFWYSPYYVNDTAKAIYRDLVEIDPAGSSYYTQEYASLNASLASYDGRIHTIARLYAGTKVAATEDIFVYLANATGLDLVSPPQFMRAVAEGNDPPAASVAAFQAQLENRSVSVLVYNVQTVTPLTVSMKALATQEGIPTVGITETVQPPNLKFQDWMNAELLALQNALGASAPGK